MERIRVHDVKTLSDDWYVLKKTTFEYQRKDGSWQMQSLSLRPRVGRRRFASGYSGVLAAFRSIS